MATCKIISHAGKGRCLNIGDSYTITNGTKVNIYAASGSKDQKWVIKNPNSQSEQYYKRLQAELWIKRSSYRY